MPTSFPTTAAEPTLCFAIVSSCPNDWGGSEELWWGAALHLLRAGHAVHIFKTYVQWRHPRIVTLLAAGGQVTDLLRRPPPYARMLGRMVPGRWHTPEARAERMLHSALARQQPHLTIVAQGGNLDGVRFATICRQLRQRYVLIAQKATDIFPPEDYERLAAQQAYQGAARCFFVSHHNMELTRNQLASPLPQAVVVANPVNVPVGGEQPAPPTAGGWQLACVARLDVLDKGQDILLQVLARAPWRARALHITFYGTGPHARGLQEMAHFLGVADKVTFAGQVADVPAIWQRSHALLMPSRYEGLPLALVEAMLCGRPAIAANAGGMAEMLRDNETGFLAPSATPDAFDEAMERAWQRRAEWPLLGAEAARHARATVPLDATADFSQLLLAVAHSVPTPAPAVAP